MTILRTERKYCLKMLDRRDSIVYKVYNIIVLMSIGTTRTQI